MASLRMLLSAVSLSITLLLWPPASPAGPKSCAELMNEIYERVKLHFIMGERQAQEVINDSLPAFKAACPTEAKSIKDLENGNYLKKLAAEREKQKKAWRHVKGAGGYTGGAGQDEDLEDLEIQR
ncbi:MAG TPA: hypothetical protein VLE03_07450 [Nitrospiraceae bacterium]|nr:hypothetical protein [Nitrospiraceae bacterium]